MHKIFVSYSRSDKTKVKKLIPLLREVYGLENVWWDENFYGGQVWWEEIRQQIAACDVFVYLMSPRSLGSPYCQAELEEAKRLRKPILPVKLRRETQVPDVLARLHFVNLSGQINRAAIPPLLRAINLHATRPPSALPPLTETPVALPQVPQSERRNWLADYAAQIVIAVVATIIGGVILAMITGQPAPVTPTPTPIVAANTLSPLEIAAATQTRDAFDFARTLEALDATDAAIQRLTATAFAPTQQAEILLTVDAINTATRAAFNAQANAQATQNAAATLAAMPTPDPLQAAYAQAASYDYRNGNGAWTPIVQNFDGIEMVLVPAGCFRMGNDPDAYQGSEDGGEQCFDAPFWIGRYEVTNAQFGSAGSFSGNQRPRVTITCFQARDFCESKGLRLPTEAEWEYAARGADSNLFPWGNAFDDALAVWNRSFEQGTANVGTLPAGASWVGALDMSGNVWEWTSTIFDDYPYRADDGREQNSDEISTRRVLRGGSWFNDGSTYLRAAARNWGSADCDFNLLGVRCARSY
jgi:formylglycine-generating enzyme required for sulfatase activity